MKTSGFPRPRLPDSAARNDVRNQVSVDPVDDAGIDISHLLQRDLILESVREELVQEVVQSA